MTMVGWTLKIESLDEPAPGQTDRTTVYWWQGEGNVTIGGITYTGATVDGAAVLDVSPIEQTQGPPVRRATVRLAVVPEMTRRLLQQDYGPLPVEIGWIRSTDGGRTWTRLPRLFKGRLSSPRLLNGIYECEIETVLGDIDRGTPYRWSYEAQLLRRQDKFFEAVASYSTGGLSVKWPP